MKRGPISERENLDRIIDAIYAAASGELPWDEGLSNLTQTFGAHGATLEIYGASPTDLRSVCVVGEYRHAPQDYYQSEMFRTDPRIPYFARIPFGSVYYDSMMYDVQEMERNETYRQTNWFVGVTYSLGFRLMLPNNTSAALAMLFTESQGHATDAAIRAAGRLLPHVERALSIGFLAEADALTRVALLDALAHKADGLILLSDAGVPTFLNDQAVSILQQQDGLSLGGGSLAACRSAETKKLGALIGQAQSAAFDSSRGCGGKMLIGRPSRKLPYLVSISPAPKTERFLASRRIAVVIQIVDLDAKQDVSKRDLIEVFGLSTREADLAVALVRAGDLEHAATACGMAFNTARNHLHSVFFKLSIHDQAELKRVLAQVK